MGRHSAILSRAHEDPRAPIKWKAHNPAQEGLLANDFLDQLMLCIAAQERVPQRYKSLKSCSQVRWFIAVITLTSFLIVPCARVR